MSSDVRDEEIEILASGYDGGISDTDSEASTVVLARSTTSDQRIQTNNEEAQFGKVLTGCSVCDMGFDGYQVILDSNENHPTVERVEELERQMQNIEKLAPTAEKRGGSKHANNNLYELIFFLVFSSSFSSCDSCRYSARVVWAARPGYGCPPDLPLCLEFPLPAPPHPQLASFYFENGRLPISSASQGQLYDSLMPFPNHFNINFHPRPAPSVANRLPRIRHLPCLILGWPAYPT